MYSEFDLKLPKATIRIPTYHNHLQLRPHVSVSIHIKIYDDVAKYLSVSMHICKQLYMYACICTVSLEGTWIKCSLLNNE